MKRPLLIVIVTLAVAAFACTEIFDFGIEGGTELPSIPPTVPAQPTVTPQPTDSPQPLYLYFAAPEGNDLPGEVVGCESTIVSVETGQELSESSVQAALEQLLAIPDEFYGDVGYYNPLAPSELAVESVEFEQAVVNVRLVGSVMIGGVCASPVMQAQLERTVLQFPDVEGVQFFINGIALQDVFSERGDGGDVPVLSDAVQSLAVSLTRQGLIIEPLHVETEGMFATAALYALVNGEEVTLYEFLTEEDATAAAATIPDILAVTRWSAPPHFYHQGTLIVLYVGENPAITSGLEGALGPQVNP